MRLANSHNIKSVKYNNTKSIKNDNTGPTKYNDTETIDVTIQNQQKVMIQDEQI